MIDPGLIKRMVDGGCDRETAVEHVETVVAAIYAQLEAGKTVKLAGIGQMRAPPRVVKVGYPPNSLRRQRKIELKHGANVEQGDPYPDPRQPKARSTYGAR